MSKKKMSMNEKINKLINDIRIKLMEYNDDYDYDYDYKKRPQATKPRKKNTNASTISILIDKALENYDLSMDYTLEELENKHDRKMKIIDVDFRSNEIGKINNKVEKKRSRDDFDYQLLRIGKFITDMTEGINDKEEYISHLPIMAQKFYRESPNSKILDDFWINMNSYMKIFDVDVEVCCKNLDAKGLESVYKKFLSFKYNTFRRMASKILYDRDDYSIQGNEIYNGIDVFNIKSIKKFLETLYRMKNDINRMKQSIEVEIKKNEHIKIAYSRALEIQKNMNSATTYAEIKKIYDEGVALLSFINYREQRYAEMVSLINNKNICLENRDTLGYLMRLKVSKTADEVDKICNEIISKLPLEEETQLLKGKKTKR